MKYYIATVHMYINEQCSSYLTKCIMCNVASHQKSRFLYKDIAITMFRDAFEESISVQRIIRSILKMVQVTFARNVQRVILQEDYQI